jgi:hypothetical protein
MQAGYGANGSISFAIADELSRAAGTGTFGSRASFSAGLTPSSVVFGDVNGDGILDLATADYLAAKSQITDADIAQESAQLLKNQILQQAGAAVLAQANQAPALALGAAEERVSDTPPAGEPGDGLPRLTPKGIGETPK